jgi:tetrahydromethanopterin S-methyltransferase subunit E
MNLAPWIAIAVGVLIAIVLPLTFALTKKYD